MPWPFPEKPWSRLHVGYAGPYRNTYFFIAVDAFSKWIEVFPVSTPSAEATISCMRIMFANQGLPDVVVSDNGPAFTSELYSTFLKKNGVNGSRGHGLLSVGAVVGAVAEDCDGPATPRTKVLQKQLKQKIRCDQGTRPRVLGHPGDQVFARNFRPDPAWLPAVVTEQRTSSMDVLLEDGRRLTRHLDHIRQPHEELSADNQKSGSPVATGLAPSLDVGQRQLTPDRLHDTESRQDTREDVARETELAVTAPSTPVLRRSTRIRLPVSRYSP
ncbi:hypothetical protein MTO96_048949 [Rhipicephalus appendiculatus]